MDKLKRGDRVPHFSVTGMDLARVAYADIWQRRNLLLVSLPSDEPTRPAADAYASQLTARAADWSAHEAVLIITRDDLPGLPRPGVLVADRWGEIYGVWNERRPNDLPKTDELLEWLRYIQHECPECQGEAR